MRFDRIFIDRHPGLESLDLAGLSPEMNVVIGADRERLAAFREFVRRVLFGCAGEDPCSGASLARPDGGLVEIVRTDGSPLTVERYRRGAGEADGQLLISRAGELRDAGGVLPGEDCALDVDRHDWQRVFNIAAVPPGSDPGALLRVACSILAGADGADIRAAWQELRDGEADLLRRIAEVGSARSVAEERRRAADADYDSYATLDGQRAETRRQLAATDSELAAIRARMHRVEVLEESIPAWSRMHAIQAAMSVMPRYPFLPPDPVARLDTLRARERELETEIESGDAGDAVRTAALERARADYDEDFPFASARRLLARRTDYADAVRDLPSAADRLEEAEAALGRGLAGLGDGWTEAGLDDIADSPGLRDRLQKLDAGMARAREEAVELAREAESAGDESEKAGDEAVSAARRLEALGRRPDATAEEARARLESIARARGEIVEKAETRRSLDSLLAKATAARPKTSISAGRLIPLVQFGMSAGFTVVGIVVWILAMAAGDTGAARTGQVVGITGVVGVAMSIAILAVQRRHSKAQHEASKVLHELAAETARELEVELEGRRVQLSYAEESLRASLDALGLPRDLPLAQLDAERERVTRELERIEKIETATADLDGANEAAKRASGRADAAAARADEARHRLDSLVSEWSNAMAGLGLPRDLALDAAIDSLDRAAQLLALRPEARGLRIRVPDMKRTVAEVEAGLSEIAGAAGLPAFPSRGADSALAELETALERAARARDRAGRLQQEEEQWAARRAAAGSELESVRRSCAELLDLVDAGDDGGFREVAAAEEERRRLAAELEEIRRSSRHLSGPAGREIEAELREHGPEDLAAEMDALQSRIGRVEETQERLAARASELDERCAELAGPPRSLGFAIEIDRLDGELERLNESLGELRAARDLVREAAAEYRSGGQPRRLQLAGEYLRRLSGGALVELRATFEDGAPVPGQFEAVRLNGVAEALDALSPGPLRQVYLAARFGLAHEHARIGRPAPVIIDDTDELRGAGARQFAAAVEELSREVQVLLLTDRPETVDRTREAATGRSPAVFELGPQGRQIALSA